MAFNNIHCRFQSRESLEEGDTTHFRLDFIRIRSANLRREWLQAIVKNIHSNTGIQDEGRHRFQSYIIGTAGSIEIHNDLDDSEIGNSSAHYQPLTDAIEALEANELTMALSVQASTTSDHSYTSNGAENLRLINPANLTNNMAGLGAALGTLSYASIRSAVKLQELINHLKPALLKRLKDISTWIRAHPYRAFGVFGGITILGLTCAIPAILEVVGFGALGPVAGSIATGWHSSLGLVAAGTPFAFLQSAAMGGAAMGMMTGIGALGSAVTIAAALTLKEGTVGGLVSSCKGAVGGAVGGAVKKFKSFFGKWKTH